MQRKIIFKDRSRGYELQLPVTPQSFAVSKSMRIETVNIHTVGDVNIAGETTLSGIKITCMFPASDYYFSTSARRPYEYVDEFIKWVEKKTPVRLIIPNTGINIEVLVESIDYGEKDGTNDVYADITLREYRRIESVQTVTPKSANKPIASDEKDEATQQSSYKAVYGDTLCGICRKFYGDGSYALATKLATYNGRPNPNILYVGEVLKIPAKSKL